MGVAEEAGRVRPIRRWRTVSEKRRIAEQTLEPGASVALVARAHGVNANQVFKWRRALKRGELSEPAAASTALLPVTLSAPSESANGTGEVGVKSQPTPGGAIHIEFPGRAMIKMRQRSIFTLLRKTHTSLLMPERSRILIVDDE